MPRIYAVLFASVVVAVGSAVVPGTPVARAEWNEIGQDWDERAPVDKTLETTEGNSLGDHFFHVEWAVSPARDGLVRITGYVYNDYGDEAVNVDLRVNELDASGRQVESLVEPIRGAVPGRGRTSFEVRVPVSASYQVSVDGFDFIEMAN